MLESNRYQININLSMGTSCLPSCVVVILFCIFHCFPHATTGSIVTHLPGFHGPLPFSLETGYVTVDEENGANMFYYFIESEGNPSEDPVLVWLAGGTRCSGLHSLSFQTGKVFFFSPFILKFFLIGNATKNLPVFYQILNYNDNTCSTGPLQFIKKPYNGSLPQLVYHQYSYTKASLLLFF